LFDALGPVWGSGPVQGGNLALVGEAPGPEEVAGRPPAPFIGRAGSVLNIACAAAGLSRSLLWVDNVVKCLPYVPGDLTKRKFRKPMLAEVEYCASRWLTPLLKERQFNCVVAMGDSALAWLVRDGKARKVTQWRGKVMEGTL
jgi:DNA polymerase